MILADGRVAPQERELIALWGGWLGWTRQRVLALGGEYDVHKKPLATRGGTYQQSLNLLGVTATSDPEQIKRAYRRLLSRHHPDKVAGTGASAVQVREATEKTRELHQAYAFIREQRGF
jgi:DnaJ like chaperone protein